MSKNSFVCQQCVSRGFDASSSSFLSKNEVNGIIGTNFARFRTFSEYAWHLKNIHNVDLRKTQTDMHGHSVTDLEHCNCFSGLWG